MILEKKLYKALDLYTDYVNKKKELKNYEWVIIKALQDYLKDYDFNSIYCKVIDKYGDSKPVIYIQIDFKDENESNNAVKTLNLFKNFYTQSYGSVEVHVDLNKENIRELFSDSKKEEK